MSDEDPQVLRISISHEVVGTDLKGTTVRETLVSPNYDRRDIKAFLAYEVEMLAVRHAEEKIGHERIHKALRAGHARLAALERMIKVLDDGPLRAAILEVFAVSNETAIDRWEERAE